MYSVLDTHLKKKSERIEGPNYMPLCHCASDTVIFSAFSMHLLAREMYGVYLETPSKLPLRVRKDNYNSIVFMKPFLKLQYEDIKSKKKNLKKVTPQQGRSLVPFIPHVWQCFLSHYSSDS